MSTPVTPTTDISQPLGNQVAGLSFEQHLSTDRKFAMDEGSLFFDGKGKVQQTLRRITTRLEQLGIPHAVAGGMCLFHHGFRRFTEDVDLLVTREGLKEIHTNLEGLGFVRLFSGSKGMRDVETKVKIDFLITGDYPGDGKPKEISFPEPTAVSEQFDGIRYLTLATLVTLKLASGLSSEQRRKDIVDVEEITKALTLPESFAQQLPPSLQREYQILWQRIHGKSQRYVKLLNTNAPPDAALLEIMLQAGVECDKTQTVTANTWYLVTCDFTLARQFDMHPEDEFFFDNE